MSQKIAPSFYMTPLGFIKAAFQLSVEKEKAAVDFFHYRQSLGFNITLTLVILIYYWMGSGLFYAELSSIMAFIPLLLLWLHGFWYAMAGKSVPMPLVGRLYQKLFSFADNLL